MASKLETISADKVDLKKVWWIDHPKKVWEREYILLILHQQGEKTKLEISDIGFPLYLVDRHIDYLIKYGKIQKHDDGKTKIRYSRTSKRHKFHYENATGKLE